MTARKPAGDPASSRVWQRMLSGRRLNLIDPSPLDIEIADIEAGWSERYSAACATFMRPAASSTDLTML